MSGAVIMIIVLIFNSCQPSSKHAVKANCSLGRGLKTEVDAEHEGSELLDIS